MSNPNRPFGNFYLRTEIPYFSGEYVDWWIYHVECFFNRYQIVPEQKLRVGEAYLVGEALLWYHQWYREVWCRLFRTGTWEEFVTDLTLHFKPPEPVTYPADELKSISNILEKMIQIIDDWKMQYPLRTSDRPMLKYLPCPDSSDISLVEWTESENVEGVCENINKEFCSSERHKSMISIKSQTKLAIETEVEPNVEISELKLLKSVEPKHSYIESVNVVGVVDELELDKGWSAQCMNGTSDNFLKMQFVVAAPLLQLDIYTEVTSIDFVFELVLNNSEVVDVDLNELLRVGARFGVNYWPIDICSQYNCRADSMLSNYASSIALIKGWCTVVCVKPPPLPPENPFKIDIICLDDYSSTESLSELGKYIPHTELWLDGLQLFANDVQDKYSLIIIVMISDGLEQNEEIMWGLSWYFDNKLPKFHFYGMVIARMNCGTGRSNLSWHYHLQLLLAFLEHDYVSVWESSTFCDSMIKPECKSSSWLSLNETFANHTVRTSISCISAFGNGESATILDTYCVERRHAIGGWNGNYLMRKCLYYLSLYDMLVVFEVFISEGTPPWYKELILFLPLRRIFKISSLEADISYCRCSSNRFRILQVELWNIILHIILAADFLAEVIISSRVNTFFKEVDINCVGLYKSSVAEDLRSRLHMCFMNISCQNHAGKNREERLLVVVFWYLIEQVELHSRDELPYTSITKCISRLGVEPEDQELDILLLDNLEERYRQAHFYLGVRSILVSLVYVIGCEVELSDYRNLELSLNNARRRVSNQDTICHALFYQSFMLQKLNILLSSFGMDVAYPGKILCISCLAVAHMDHGSSHQTLISDVNELNLYDFYSPASEEIQQVLVACRNKVINSTKDVDFFHGTLLEQDSKHGLHSENEELIRRLDMYNTGFVLTDDLGGLSLLLGGYILYKWPLIITLSTDVQGDPIIVFHICEPHMKVFQATYPILLTRYPTHMYSLVLWFTSPRPPELKIFF